MIRDDLGLRAGDHREDGDDTRFKAAVREYTPRLLGVARRLTGDHSEAEDLVQETWITAYRHRDAFTNGSYLAWLLVIMRRGFLQHHRSSARRIAREGLFARERGSTEYATADSGTDHDPTHLFDALDKLTARQRDVVVERIMAERSTADTARMLGIAEGTVKATLSQALHRLRQLLDHSDDLP